MTFEKGQRVVVHGRFGTVAFQRLAAPTYQHAEAVSVVMDDQRDLVGYEGTMWRADEVKPAQGLSWAEGPRGSGGAK